MTLADAILCYATWMHARDTERCEGDQDKQTVEHVSAATVCRQLAFHG